MNGQATISFCGAVLGWTVLGLSDCAAQDQAAAPAPNLIQVLKTAQPVNVDGALDEDCWKQAAAVKADYIWGGNGKESADPRMVARYAWDDRFLYIAYETFDTNLVAKPNGRVKGPAGNQREGCEISSDPPEAPVDVVEFFVGFDDPNMFWEIHHTAANHFNDILVFAGLPAWKKERPAMAGANIYWAANEYIQDADEHKLARAARVKPRADGKPSSVNDGSDADTGYTAEMRLPWDGIGAPLSARSKEGWKKMAGREIAIMAVVQNGDLDDRYFTSCPTLPKGDFFHNNFARWPRYKLADGAAAAK